MPRVPFSELTAFPRDDVYVHIGQTYMMGYQWRLTVIEAQGIMLAGKGRVAVRDLKGRQPGTEARGCGTVQQNENWPLEGGSRRVTRRVWLIYSLGAKHR